MLTSILFTSSGSTFKTPDLMHLNVTLLNVTQIEESEGKLH